MSRRKAESSEAASALADAVLANYEDEEEMLEGASLSEADADIDDSSEGGAVTAAAAETDEDLAEHEEVSNIGNAAEAAGKEFMEDGLEAALAESANGQEIEHVDGYDESLLELDRENVQQYVTDERLLDAWYAEFADPAVQALVSRQRDLSETIAEVVIGKDDRVRITNTTAFPWRAICSLRITAADGSTWIGTGWLVAPRTVMTAGHCVYIHSRGGWVKSIEVVPGRNGSSEPYGSCTATAFRSVKGWTKNKKRSHDYGAIILPASCPMGAKVGYFGYANLGLASLMGLKVNLSGYPGDKPSGTQWWHARRIKFVTSRTIVYNIDTAGGQSGSPVWRLKNGKRHAVGIHTNGASTGNSATRITKPVFNNIKKWKAQGM